MLIGKTGLYLFKKKELYSTYNSLHFPIELNRRGSKTPTFTYARTNYYNGKLSIDIFFPCTLLCYELKTLIVVYGL